MSDWKQLAAARGLPLTDSEIERIAGPLDALEANWRSVLDRIPYETEPAVVMQCPPLPAGRERE
jgi:hypothetical protein